MINTTKSVPARILIMLCAFLIPGSGLVILGKPVRGFMYLVWMLFFGYLTYKYSLPATTPIGRFAGGIAVWALSIVETWRVLSRGSSRH